MTKPKKREINKTLEKKLGFFKSAIDAVIYTAIPISIASIIIQYPPMFFGYLKDKIYRG